MAKRSEDRAVFLLGVVVCVLSGLTAAEDPQPAGDGAGPGGLSPGTLDVLRQRAQQTYPLLFDRDLTDTFLSNALRDLGGNLSDRCFQDTKILLMDIVTFKLYALKVLDATGRPESGLFSGNIRWLGSYDQCRQTVEFNNITGEQIFQGQYCLVTVKGPLLPGKLAQGGVSLGVCVPQSCKEQDLQPLLRTGMRLLMDGLNVTGQVVNATLEGTTVSCPHALDLSGGDYVAIVVCSILALLALIGTGYDIVRRIGKSMEPREGVTVFTPTPDGSEVGVDFDKGLVNNEVGAHGQYHVVLERSSRVREVLHKILLAFSAVTNGGKLLSAKVREGTLGSVNGIRVLSMWWVILGHSYLFTANIVSNPVEALSLVRRFSFQAILNGTFSVDTFFLLSGLLLAYLTLRELNKNEKLNWPLLYVHRIWRLTPVYMFVVLMYTTLTLHIPDGPFMRTMDGGAENCKKYWWTNLLYINNFYPNFGKLETQCMGWAWYLANDMQFFIISPFIIYLLHRYRYAGYGVLTALTVTCLAVTGGLARKHHIKSPLEDASVETIYVHPYTRISPYLVGIATGYCLNVWSMQGKPRLHKVGVCIGWCVAIATNMAVLYGSYGPSHYGTVWTYDVTAFYAAVSRFAWSLGVAWVVFACVTGCGGPVNVFLSWGVWAPLGRLTYCAYLVHPIVMFSFILSQKVFINFTDYNAIHLYIGHLVISYLVAFAVSVVIEAPMMALEKIVFKRKTN